MGASTDHALGRNLNFYCKVETTAGAQYGTTSQEQVAADDAAKVLTTSMEFSVARTDRMDSRTTRSVLERITGKQEISWSCESYLLPAGAAYGAGHSATASRWVGFGALCGFSCDFGDGGCYGSV
jgi:hypothetical protein